MMVVRASQRKAGVAADTKELVRGFKRTLIIDAAATLFEQKGFQKTTIDDIATAISVTKPFLYTYFDSKYSILEALFDVVYDDLYSNVNKALDDTSGAADERLRRFMDVYVLKNIERRTFSAIMLEEEKNLSPAKVADIRRKQHQFDKKLARLIETGAKEGLFNVRDADLASLAISGMVRWIHRWYSPDGRMTSDELGYEMTSLVLKMLSATSSSAKTGLAASKFP